MKKIIALATTIILYILSSQTVVAETEKMNNELSLVGPSVAFEIPIPALAIEFGTLTANDSLMTAKVQITDENVYGGEISFNRRRDVDGRHWLGGAVGHMQDDNQNNLIDFDLDTYVSINYKYYNNGVSSEGFYFYSSIRAFDGGVFPWLGFGYNF